VTDDQVVEAMTRYGGSFVQALAVCWLRADAVNRAILQRAFPATWTQYAELVDRRDRRERARGPV
jgi:hypothetical protein